MHRKFWDENKNTVQLVILLNALCGIFLNIPRPKNKSALNDLNNLQMFLLLLASFSMIYLFFKVVRWAALVEINLSGGWKFFDEVLTTSVGLGGLWFIFNLWSYLFSAYSSSIKGFLSIATYPLMLLFISIYMFLLSKIKFKDTSILQTPKRLGSILISLILALPLGLAWAGLNMINSTRNSLGNFVLSAAVISLLLALAFIFLAQKQSSQATEH